jgi:hypothetical protein
MHWLTRDWWAYLLERPSHYATGYPYGVWWRDWPNRIWCRWHAHPAGPWWYGNGWEPDMKCKNCGDDLG